MNEPTEFLRGFASTSGIPIEDAADQWEAFSRNLSQSERERDEAGGWSRGEIMGIDFKSLYGGQKAND